MKLLQIFYWNVIFTFVGFHKTFNEGTFDFVGESCKAEGVACVALVIKSCTVKDTCEESQSQHYQAAKTLAETQIYIQTSFIERKGCMEENIRETCKLPLCQ